jgi:DNA replication protein DnaC
LARAAAHAGYRTYFSTAADPAARCQQAAIEGRRATTMRFYAGPTLLVIDQLGYLPLHGEAAAALFQVVSQRYLKSSIVMTTNRGVGFRGEVLGDNTVAAAMLDRLLLRSVVLNPRRRFLPHPRPQRPLRETSRNHQRNSTTATLNSAHR